MMGMEDKPCLASCWKNNLLEANFKNKLRGCTPLKTNMSLENQWLEDVFPIEMVPFGGTC